MMSRIQLVLLVIGAISTVGLATKHQSSRGKTLSLSKILVQASKDSLKDEKESQDQCPVCPETSSSSCPVCNCLNDTRFEVEQVAFTAQVLGNRAVTEGQLFTFDQILVDSSDSFTPIGFFDCPDSDIYFISWSIHALERRVIGKLVMDDTDVKYGPVTAEYPGDQSGTASMSTAVQCSAGAKVYVKAIGWPDALSCNQLEGSYSSITGFKIFSASSPDPRVAFTAEFSTNSTATSGTLIFDRVLTNLGDAYNYQNGRFTCPANGVYVFNINHHITSSGVSTILRRNGSNDLYTAYAYNTYSTSSDSGTASATVLLECNQGDYIDVYGHPSLTYLAQTTSFAGFQLVDPERPLIAFHARLSADTAFIDGNTIKFDVAETNVGGFYYSSLGTFICPEDGLYFFAWTICQISDYSDDRPTEARLMVGGEVWKKGPKTMINYSNRYSSASTQAVVQCPEQTAVWLEAVMTTSPTTAMTLNYFHTHFTGFRIPNI